MSAVLNVEQILRPSIHRDMTLFDQLSAQGEELVGQVHYSQKITEFVEDSDVHEAIPNNFESTMMELPSQAMTVDLMNFITRPYILTNFTWSSTDVFGSEIYAKGSLPADKTPLLTLPSAFKTKIQNKLNNIQYWRPEIELEVRVNGTNFHYGRLMFAVYPLGWELNPIYKASYNASTWKWFQVNPAAHQTVKFTLPYVHHMKKLSLTPNGLTGATRKQMTQMYEIRCFVMSPLLSAQQAAVAPVEVVVWGRIVNPGFSSYTFADSDIGAQGEEEENAKQGIVNTDEPLLPPLLSVDLNALNRTIDKISRIGLAGLSVPPNRTANNSMQLKNLDIARVDDTPNTRLLGASQGMAMRHEPNLVNACPSETNIVKFCSHPSLLYVGRLQAADKQNAIVWQQEVNFAHFDYHDFAFDPEVGTSWPTPLMYITRLFKFWRGSLKIHFSFIASSYHSAKLRFCWVPKPGPSQNFPISLNVDQTSNMLNVVMDINKQTEYSIIVPWDSNFDFIDIDNVSSEFANGKMYLQVINALTSSFNTPQPIYFQIFVSCAEDFQVALPRFGRSDHHGNPDYDSVPIPPVSVSTQTMHAQEGDVTECELPSSSYRCLMNQKYIPLGGSISSYRLDRVSNSYEMTDLMQLAHMLTPWFSGDWDSGQFYHRLNPYGHWMDAWDQQMWECAFPHLVAIFRYMRGSFRFAVTYRGNAIDDFAAVADMDGFAINKRFDDGETAGIDYNKLSYGGYFSTKTADTTADIFDVTLPYYCDISCIPTNFYSNATFITCPSLVWSIWASKAFYIIVLSAAGDDFMFGYQMGIPRIRYATS